jgi:hypothetical protein
MAAGGTMSPDAAEACIAVDEDHLDCGRLTAATDECERHAAHDDACANSRRVNAPENLPTAPRWKSARRLNYGDRIVRRCAAAHEVV